MKILIAEDDCDMQKILKLYLEREGYETAAVSNGGDAVSYLLDHTVDLVLLDWMMPVKDGISACREIRSLNIPTKILMLTAKGEIEHEITGLSCGADDYLRKPFDIQVLLLRVKKLCAAEGVLTYQDLFLNPDTREVTKSGKPLTLTKTEFELLRCFLTNQRIVLTREQLLNQVWGMDFEGELRTVDTHIRRLRKKIGEEMIHTRIGVGYVMGENHE